MKVFYWSPFFTEIATISAVINSAKSLIKYPKKDKYSVRIINAIGEWDEHERTNTKNISFKKLSKKNYIKKIPKHGFLKSRFSYLFIFAISFFKLLMSISLFFIPSGILLSKEKEPFQDKIIMITKLRDLLVYLFFAPF